MGVELGTHSDIRDVLGGGSRWAVAVGDCRDVMRSMPDNAVHSIVCDPPYGLSFMGKGWDHAVPGEEYWAEALRVARPGAHLLAFGGTRTFHRMACAIEDAGWEIRDTVMWVYGSGFPKSLDVSKAIDKAAGAEREVYLRVARKVREGETKCAQADRASEFKYSHPATDAARRWHGWGTALKPAWEPVIVARKPLDGTVAANVQAWGTGAINVDGCRVGTGDTRCWHNKAGIWSDHDNPRVNGSASGRWPANLIHDGSDEVVAGFPGEDSGSAARFFYCAKASKADRDYGLESVEPVHRPNGNKWTDQDYRVSSGERPPSAESGPRRNVHPTVKPTALMRYLCRLVTPPGGVVLDPFTGSGSTGKAAVAEGFSFTGAEIDDKYAEIARGRIAAAENELQGGISWNSSNASGGVPLSTAAPSPTIRR